MIISRTPFRLSFFGGGTDYPAWYRAHGGAVLATTIDKYCYITCRELPPFFEHRIRIVYSKIENCSRVEDVALHGTYALAPAEAGRAGGRRRGRDDLVAEADEVRDEPRADVAGGAEDQDAHHASPRWARRLREKTEIGRAHV